jgi:hypothetical protein
VVQPIPQLGSIEARSVAQRLAPAPEFRRALEASAAKTGTVGVVRTPLTSGEAANALTRAWTEVVGDQPTGETTALLTAQWAHETGRGASMFNYNFGGIKGEGPSGLSVAQRTREGWGATERTIVDRFRAYESADQGAVDYVKLLVKRFPEAVEAARKGDATGFVHGLKTRGYFTGDQGAYTRSVHRLASEFSGVDPSSLQGPIPDRFGVPRVAEATSSGGEAFDDGEITLPADTPFVSALALADEISRAALRIAAEPNTRRDRT